MKLYKYSGTIEELAVERAEAVGGVVPAATRKESA